MSGESGSIKEQAIQIKAGCFARLCNLARYITSHEDAVQFVGQVMPFLTTMAKVEQLAAADPPAYVMNLVAVRFAQSGQHRCQGAAEALTLAKLVDKESVWGTDALSVIREWAVRLFTINDPSLSPEQINIVLELAHKLEIPEVEHKRLALAAAQVLGGYYQTLTELLTGLCSVPCARAHNLALVAFAELQSVSESGLPLDDGYALINAIVLGRDAGAEQAQVGIVNAMAKALRRPVVTKDQAMKFGQVITTADGTGQDSRKAQEAFIAFMVHYVSDLDHAVLIANDIPLNWLYHRFLLKAMNRQGFYGVNMVMTITLAVRSEADGGLEVLDALAKVCGEREWAFDPHNFHRNHVKGRHLRVVVVTAPGVDKEAFQEFLRNIHGVTLGGHGPVEPEHRWKY